MESGCLCCRELVADSARCVLEDASSPSRRAAARHCSRHGTALAPSRVQLASVHGVVTG